MNTPVVFIIFNRPDVTRKTFLAIQQAKPSKLLVISDGPRADRPGEVEKCQETRQIIDGVDWDCEVLKNYSDVNLGCGKRISSGLNWAFETVEEAIILEDDCFPDPSFFPFCDVLLEKYRYDERVSMVCGTNVLGSWKSDSQSYHFSNYTTVWGWATWKRAWNDFDYEINLWSNPETKNILKQQLGHDGIFSNRERMLNEIANKNLDAWGLQWFLARVLNSGLSIIPAVNLVSNIGFSEDSTHTGDSSDPRSNLATKHMNFPLKEPIAFYRDRDYESLSYETVERKTILEQVKRKLGKIKRLLRA